MRYLSGGEVKSKKMFLAFKIQYFKIEKNNELTFKIRIPRFDQTFQISRIVGNRQ